MSVIFASINLFTDGRIKCPVWSIFVLLMIGHFISFFLFFRTIYLSLKSINQDNSNADYGDSEIFHVATENRFPLIQYTLCRLFQLGGILIFIFLMEVFFYTDIMGSSPAYLYLIPVYAMSAIGLLNTILCR